MKIFLKLCCGESLWNYGPKLLALKDGETIPIDDKWDRDFENKDFPRQFLDSTISRREVQGARQTFFMEQWNTRTALKSLKAMRGTVPDRRRVARDQPRPNRCELRNSARPMKNPSTVPLMRMYCSSRPAH